MDEVRSVFQEAMSNRSDFPFVFLQPTGTGARTLTVTHTHLKLLFQPIVWNIIGSHAVVYTPFSYM